MSLWIGLEFSFRFSVVQLCRCSFSWTTLVRKASIIAFNRLSCEQAGMGHHLQTVVYTVLLVQQHIRLNGASKGGICLCREGFGHLYSLLGTFHNFLQTRCHIFVTLVSSPCVLGGVRILLGVPGSGLLLAVGASCSLSHLFNRGEGLFHSHGLSQLASRCCSLKYLQTQSQQPLTASNSVST